MPVEYLQHPILAAPVNVLGARVYGGNYQNTTLRPMLVIVGSQHTSGGVGSQARTVAYTDAAFPPGPTVSYSGWLNAPGIGGTILHGSHVFMVPAGWWYTILSLVAGGGGNDVNSWYEVGL